MRTLVCSFLLSALGWVGLNAQSVLLYENFNGCALPAGWAVNIDGNPDAVWYVGTMQNDDALGQSIDGTCCLIVDDDATGNNTPAFAWTAASPAFDASQFSTILLDMDIHYRDWNEDDEYLEIWITDGATQQKLTRFENTSSTTGDSLHEHRSYQADLSLFTNSNNVRLMFRYDDAGGFAWWAAFDNVAVLGYGDGTNVVRETFNDCQKPSGWSTEIVTGVDDWKFGLITEGVALGGNNSMDGSCFAFFDDDILGQDTPFSNVRLISPWFDGTAFGKFELNFDVILRYYKETIAAIVQHADGTEYIVQVSQGDVGGPYFQNYLHATLDLSPYRAAQMRIIFEYDDGKDWGWWAGLDNVKITGSGDANDICANAVPLVTGEPCKSNDNYTALLDGPLPTCAGTAKSSTGLWYTWQPAFTGIAELDVRSEFNDLVEVFTGNCATPTLLQCNNRDEHGFTGEKTYFNVQSGSNYLLRVSNLEGVFGKSRGSICISVKQVPAVPAKPANDDCANAVSLTVGAACSSGNNRNALTSATLPSLNERARADVWYRFTAPAVPAGQVLEVASNATFSDIITVYQGGCNALQEVAGSHHGGHLALPALTAGQTYWLQIAGNFASIEGTLCPQITQKSALAPANDNCVAATGVPVGGQCASGNNEFASFSGITPACVVSIDRDIWFKFTAPNSGAVRLNTGADFQHVMAVWQGTCGDLEQIACADNPNKCEGYLLVGSLNPGEVYWVQVATQVGLTGSNTGDVCLKITDGSAAPEFSPLLMSVKEVCLGNNTAQLNIEVAGGVAPFTFEGSPSGQVLPEGQIYIVVVTDALGCVKSLVDIVDDCDATGACTVSNTLLATNPTCHNASNGGLEALVLGGSGPYAYAWSNGATTVTNNNLPAGTYTVTVTDALLCTSTAQFALPNPTAIEAIPTGINNPNQGQTNGSIYVDLAGGAGQYTQQWILNGQPVTTAEDLTNAGAGIYTLVVTDGNGCTALFNYTLTETVAASTLDGEIFAEIFPNPAKDKATLGISFPKAVDLVISLTDAAGRGLHTWSVSGVTEANIPLDIQDLPAGAYQVRVWTGNELVVRKLLIQ